MKRLTVITIKSREDDDFNNIDVLFTTTDENDNIIPSRHDAIILAIEQAKMQILGQAFMKGAMEKAQQCADADRALLQSTISSLQTATEITKRMLINKTSAKKKKKS